MFITIYKAYLLLLYDNNYTIKTIYVYIYVTLYRYGKLLTHKCVDNIDYKTINATIDILTF